MTINLSNGEKYEGSLVVVNEYARGMSHRRQFRLYWESPDGNGGVPAYGFCSEPLFTREGDAIARGLKAFGVKAERRAW